MWTLPSRPDASVYVNPSDASSRSIRIVRIGSSLVGLGSNRANG